MTERDSVHSADACNSGGDDVQRDMDLVRDLLLYFEARQDPSLIEYQDVSIDARSELEIGHHLNLLFNAGLLIAEPVTTDTGRVIYVIPQTLSWAGHEFLDNIRDPEIWKQTKSGAAKAGGWSLKVIASIAEGILKARVDQLFASGQIGF
ncbi:hypothetical protein D3C80_818160 [compost metagenome]